jgi:hypothetical protein
MQIKFEVGDVIHWNDGNWDLLCIYRGPSFSEGFHWFDFLLERKETYENNGFHCTESNVNPARVIGHIPGVKPIRWNGTQRASDDE